MSMFADAPAGTTANAISATVATSVVVSRARSAPLPAAAPHRLWLLDPITDAIRFSFSIEVWMCRAAGYPD